ncbi:MAG: Minf_1886 family protein [Candidatus Omnitrophota bacterium]
MSEFYDLVDQIRLQDKRYKPDAYEFVLGGLDFTQKKLKKTAHVSGAQLACGLRDYAINQYGALAGRVLSYWGINQTEDFGNIVFNMIEKKLLSKTEEDSLLDFDAVYNFKAAFSNVLANCLEQEIKEKKR